MTFRFLAEDFDRYIKKGKPGDGVHNGRHIWDDLLDQLKAEFGVPFSPAAWKSRGDWLELLWLAPSKSPRGTWANQAQFFLSRSIQDKKLHFGLCIEFELLKGTTSAASDRDGWRFLQQLQDENFARVLDALLTYNDWDATIRDWGDKLHSVAKNSAEIAAALGKLEQDGGWNVHIQKTLDASTAVDVGEEISRLIVDAFLQVRPLWEAVIPEADREYLSGRTPGSIPPRSRPPVNVAALLTVQLVQEGLYFTPWQLATFYTALQTKGFVILSGISGTGKTKLAQHFAAMLPQPTEGVLPASDDVSVLTVQPYMLRYNRAIIPAQTARLFNPPEAGTGQDVIVKFDGQSQSCRLVNVAYSGTHYLQLLFRGAARSWFKQSFKEGDALYLEVEQNADGGVAELRFSKTVPVAPGSRLTRLGKNYLFMPVRPDWRDSKSLLGYYNPLTSTYEWTPFLYFLLRAEQNFKSEDKLAWFVILDEMNLAHVEYYFADLLSVLESGRDEDGWTREPLRLGYPDEAEGNLPPRELKLPPNLYIVGTVNMDETTHAFSPKVLDRTFTLELTDVDFSAYPTARASTERDLSDEERGAVLKDFTRSGTFALIDKRIVATHVTAHPEVRGRLQSLNELLHPYDLHFGYRVFDEIVSFLAAAGSNNLYDDPASAEVAFDAVVLMKVLPKFHGSRSRLETPLCAVLAWCANPGTPDIKAIRDALQEVGPEKTVRQAVMAFQFLYPRTAERVQRMLDRLYTDGFAAFG